MSCTQPASGHPTDYWGHSGLDSFTEADLFVVKPLNCHWRILLWLMIDGIPSSSASKQTPDGKETPEGFALKSTRTWSSS